MSEVMEVDVAWAGTPISSARAALEWVHVGPGDVLVDLGCGDGRVALEAAQLGAHAVCIERDFDLAETARRLFDGSAAGGRVTTIHADLFSNLTSHLSNATVVFLFLLPELNARLRTHLSTRVPTLRAVVSHHFEVRLPMQHAPSLGLLCSPCILNPDGTRIQPAVVRMAVRRAPADC